MVLAPRIEIKQSQKLMMTPQMQQAIQLLQLTNLQVTDMLKREMEQNPFLAFDAQHYRDRQGAAVQQAVKVSGTSGVGLGKEVEAVQVDFAADSQQDFGQQQADKSDTSLAAHLTRQIGEEMRDAAQAKLALELVGWLDEDGYLRESDAEICSTLGVPQRVWPMCCVSAKALPPPVFLPAIWPIVCACNCMPIIC